MRFSYNLSLDRNEKSRKRQRIALKGAEPKMTTDSDSSSCCDGDSGTRSSYNGDHNTGKGDEESPSSQSEESNSIEQDITINIPDSVKHILEEDYININHGKKVSSSKNSH